MIFDVIPRFFENLTKRKFNQEQLEGMLDVITFVMVSDGVTATEEREELERAISGVRWEGTGTVEGYVADAERRLKDSSNPPDFLQRAASAITEDWMQDEVYYLAARMAGADKQIVAEETTFLHHLTAAFGIEGTRLRLITRRLIDEDHA